MRNIKIIYLLLLLLFPLSLNSQTRIKMQKEGGVYTVPCEVNGLKLRFIFDTGASNVCISLTEVMFMLKNGYLDYDDIVGSSQAEIADGSIVDNTEIILREIKIGNKILTNVEASVMHNLKAPLLLGQSAIEQLGTIKLDGDELVIVAKRKSSKSTTNSSNSSKTTTPKKKTNNGSKKSTAPKSKKSDANKSVEAKEWLKKASDYYKNKQYAEAINAYAEAAKLDRSAFETSDFYTMGKSCYELDEFDAAITCYKGAKLIHNLDKPDYAEKQQFEYWIRTNSLISVSEMMAYIKMNNYEEAITVGEDARKQYNNSRVIKGLDQIYSLMSLACAFKKDYNKAIENMTMSYESYIAERYGSNFSLKDLEKKNVEDDVIGTALYRIATFYESKKDNKNYQSNLKKAAAFGDKKAKDELKKK